MILLISVLINIANCFHGNLKSIYPNCINLYSSRGLREYAPSAAADSRGPKPYGRSSSGGGRGDYRSNSRGGNRRPVSDSLLQLRFSKTVKIDPENKLSIEEMNFSEKTAKVLKEKGFSQMTPVQSQSYEYVHSGQDVVARSRTGTGKTLAFGLPLIEKIIATKQNLNQRGGSGLPLVLILEPTRELALQVAQELGSVAAVHGLKVAAMYGGVSMFPQEKALQNGVHILVATPGRTLDHISRGNLELGFVEHVVLDEGDTMLEMGFQNDVESILANVKTPGDQARLAATKSLNDFDDSSFEDRMNLDIDDDIEDDEDEDDMDFKLPKSISKSGPRTKSPDERDVQMLLFSATMAGWICKLTSKHMNDPVFLDAVQEGETRLASTIKHFAIKLPHVGDRIKSISTSVENLILTHGGGGQTIVFTNTKDEADNIVAADCFGQLRAQVLHGDISQAGRQTTIKQFKDGQIDVLVATGINQYF